MAKTKALIFLFLFTHCMWPSVANSKDPEESEVFSLSDKKREILRICRTNENHKLLGEVNTLFVILGPAEIDLVLEDLKSISTRDHSSDDRAICHSQLDWAFDEMKKKYNFLECGSHIPYNVR